MTFSAAGTPDQGKVVDFFADLLKVSHEDIELFLATNPALVSDTVINSPANYTCQVGYVTYMWGISAFATLPATNPGDLARVEFNITNTRDSRTVFQNQVNFGSLVGSTGNGNILYFLPGIKKFPGKTELRFNFTRADAAIFGAFTVGGSKAFGVTIHGARVRSDIET